MHQSDVYLCRYINLKLAALVNQRGSGRSIWHFLKLLRNFHQLASDWYRERLRVKQDRDMALWTRHPAAAGTDAAQARLEYISSSPYLASLVGMIGADFFTGQT